MTAETSPNLMQTLAFYLPTCARSPFSDDVRLDVVKLRKAIEKSHETVYKWLRNDRLPAREGYRIVTLANQTDNINALTQLGRIPPTADDFSRFISA